MSKQNQSPVEINHASVFGGIVEADKQTVRSTHCVEGIAEIGNETQPVVRAAVLRACGESAVCERVSDIEIPRTADNCLQGQLVVVGDIIMSQLAF